ncbi:PilW family protein [Acetobacterium sp.]|jgi:Tfp pilus assembly protein PilV|uniref:PilW family protein n=1 Tax=Acetobacterium sp. TaxID=1872094 RepID=UPI000CABE467|nr:prepilin-type N-terminal cleavage/methylation domain-containing protein [Acetobacterium sp.]MDO9492803.1 prepilin-type N-terminal cleavage/methylation domain-containing protein [Acetobacterium sp.]PKM73458.1 MAG: hypothetical protein CVU92_06645 [Firmicutes bacterium HGW-Firmicutes-17]
MKKLRINLGSNGFSLVELMVALLITVILMVTIISVFLMSQKIYTRGTGISYKQKSITNIETDLQNALAIATDISIGTSKPSTGIFYGIGFNNNGECIEVINGVEYQTDQIMEISVNVTNGNTMNYEIVPKDSMSILKGGIVMNNIKSTTIDATFKAGTEGYLVITLVN